MSQRNEKSDARDSWRRRFLATLGVAAARGHIRTSEIVVLAAGGALAFAGIDLWYGLAGEIRPVYLADAVLELGFVAALAGTRRG